MAADGYSDEADWEELFNEDFTSARFTLMNKRIARKINMFIFGVPGTDVGADYTDIAEVISDEMIAVYMIFLKESGMENPPEFIHYKLPRFTPAHRTDLNTIKGRLGYIGGVG